MQNIRTFFVIKKVVIDNTNVTNILAGPFWNQDAARQFARYKGPGVSVKSGKMNIEWEK